MVANLDCFGLTAGPLCVVRHFVVVPLDFAAGGRTTIQNQHHDTSIDGSNRKNGASTSALQHGFDDEILDNQRNLYTFSLCT